MKYLSVLVFAILLGWTWNVIHEKPAIPFETHAGIQEKLAQLIQQTIMNKKPLATDIRIEKVWTVPQSAGSVLAHFIYSFQEPDTNGKSIGNQIQGEGLLEKQADDQSGLEKWSLKNIKTTSDAITFEEGTLVTPGEEPAIESNLTQPANEKQ